MAATEGSFSTTPSPFTNTRVLAVPRSTASSLAGRQVLRLTSWPFRARASLRKALAEATAGLISIATVTVKGPFCWSSRADSLAYVRDGCVSPGEPRGRRGRHALNRSVSCQREKQHTRRVAASLGGQPCKIRSTIEPSPSQVRASRHLSSGVAALCGGPRLG